MTQTKLEIIGPYTPEHEGPFCTRSGAPVDIRVKDGRGGYPLIGYIGNSVSAYCWRQGGIALDGVERPNDLMNAREVPVAREFWLSEYKDGTFSRPCKSKKEALQLYALGEIVGAIHVREVLPGEGA